MSAAQAPDVVVRELHTHQEYLACVALQEHTWGRGFTERVPPGILLISQKMGGIVAGAFDASGRMLGFVYGITGLRGGRPAHWSHMLGVREEARGRGLGKRLKLYQREVLLSRGVDLCYWTYDPLVARNASLNLNRLGARIEEYEVDLYGPDTASELHSGLGTDRFIVAWHLAAPEVKAALASPREGPPLPADAPVVNAGALVSNARAPVANADAPVASADALAGRSDGPAGGTGPREPPLPEAPRVRVEVPDDIYTLLHADVDLAWQWRVTTRRAFRWYLSRGYRVTGFGKAGGRCFYLVER